MTSARAALALLRTALTGATQAVELLEASLGQDADELLDLDDAGERYGIPASTLRRWARDGRLRAVELERGRVACWRSALVEAIDAAPYRPAVRSVPAATDAGGDLLEDALASGELRAGGRR